jgi:hypothetical protein
MKKTWQRMVKETFTNTFDERYAEASKGERTVYWLFIVFAASLIAAGWLRWLGWL